MGAQEDNRLTLEGLAQRLEALERENERMRSENNALQSKVATLEGSGKPSTEDGEPPASEWSGSDGQVSRKWLLSKAGAAAVGTVAAGALMLRDTRQAEAAPSRWTTDTLLRGAVEGFNQNGSGYGVWGDCANWRGVYGTGRVGVFGEGTSYGLYGAGRNDEATAGVFGWGNDRDGIGVRGLGFIGVEGSGLGIGVKGMTFAPNVGAVEGHNNGGGTGVVGVGKVGLLAFSHTDGWNAVWGRHTGNGRAVAGDSARGYGEEFKGGKAQLRLVPGGSAGAPTGAHSKGELYVDSGGRCSCAWSTATRLRGGRSRRPPSERCTDIPPF
jgi:hypothetical protein